MKNILSTKLKPFHYKILEDMGVDLNSFYILELINNGYLITSMSEKAIDIRQTLQRKGFITEIGEITLQGKEILEVVELKSTTHLKKIKTEINNKFEEWWVVYPATDYFERDGKVFSGTQKKNLKKDECQVLFMKYVNSKEFSAEEIIRATAFHVDLAKRTSSSTKGNQVSFIPNSFRYLNERYFLPYIKLSQNKVLIKEENNSFTGVEI